LTIVVPKRKELPDAVTAGGSTVGVRCPNHAVARALITEAGVPIAAPSANRSTGLSPTRAEHVLAALNGRIDLILDGGPCPGGIESTVVDATGKTVRLLRPGLITVPMLESVVSVSPPRQQGTEPARSPGQMAKHYSPRTPIRLVHGDSLADDYLEARQAGLRFACVTFYREETEDDDGHPGGAFVNLPSNPERAAAMLYDALFRLDQKDLHMILVELPADTPAWAAIRDRLMRAAT
jgi:L-threonylcarbamoyladenylate synthase